MSTILQRSPAFVLFVLAAVLADGALSQSDSTSNASSNAGPAVGSQASTETSRIDADEEVTVRGRRTLRQYRLEVEEARAEIIEIFNESNSNDDNDVICRNERVTGTRMPKRICRSRAQDKADAAAASQFLYALLGTAGNFMSPEGAPPLPGGPQINALVGTAVARTENMTRDAEARAQLDEELKRLQRENRRLHRAVVKYLELEEEYLRAREEVGQ